MHPEWLETFQAVDRAAFLPDRMWPWDMIDKRSYDVDRPTDPEAWYAAADSDVPLVTQWDDGAHTGDQPGRVATSSSSAPSVVYQLLGDLDLDHGMSVLDVGTGTGETAGALLHRAGRGLVTTVEVDHTVSAHAASRLRAAGLHPHTVVGDGSDGYRARAPYHRILVTFALRDFPGALIEQTRRGGLLVAPWGTIYSHANAVACLRSDGSTASGHFLRGVEFMQSRSQRQRIDPSDYVPAEGVNGADVSTAALTEDEFGSGRFGPLPFILGLRVPGCVQAAADRKGTSRPVWFYSLTDRSWACVLFRDGTRARVWQSGPRRLWNEVEAAYQWWTGLGQPGIDRFGLTVTPEGQRVWLDDPQHAWAV
ncbi:protein-L-isoaspartate(D-aspartate) O-methyltransferase [Streptomyces gilvosporeus]|uniref:Protein-L-isoaspartate O-methyltransferase n=2 Tax=Streptomyces gilvosporeus TaxID=553510 RepID=A0A1V0U2A0_9ACTN|nr:protein-L-isoaspartate(D-aspartate) O-methyltransferase [Streptomyces gilvosporeus]